MQASDLARSNALALLARHARTKPTAVAFRSKHLGIYRERTWRDYAGLVARAAAGLKRLGVMRGERVAIMGDPCEEWMSPISGPRRSAPSATASIRPPRPRGRIPAARWRGVGLRRPGPGIRGSHPALRGPSARAALHRGRRHLGHVQLRAPEDPWPERGARRASAGDDELAALEALAAAIAPTIPPSSSTPRARPATPRAPWSRTAGIWPAPQPGASTIRSWPSRSAPWSTCRSATCWDATSR